MRPSSTVGTLIKVFGRYGANRSTSPRQQSCVGWRCIVVHTWPAAATTTIGPNDGSLLADRIKAEICERGVDDGGRFRQAYENDELESSLLLIPIMGFLPPSDERVKRTVLAIAEESTQDDLVLRYKVSTTDTGFEGEEGTFTICSFWLVTALAMIKETARARMLCTKLLNFASPLLLYAEEIDASTGEHLGNFPQAFTHLALIEAVSHLIEAEATP